MIEIRHARLNYDNSVLLSSLPSASRRITLVGASTSHGSPALQHASQYDVSKEKATIRNWRIVLQKSTIDGMSSNTAIQ